MNQSFGSQSYVETYETLCRACEWLEDLGVEYSRTRIGKYKKLFSDAARYQLNNTLAEFERGLDFLEWVNASFEVHEINRIYTGLKDERSNAFVHRLRCAVKGHHLFSKDQKDRSGRDVSFELLIAAKFSNKGYLPDFGHAADLSVKFEEHRLFIECKRLKSASKVENRIHEGLHQLTKRYSHEYPSKQHRGLLILSIGKLVNQELGYLEAADQAALGEIAYSQVAKFAKDFRFESRDLRHKKTLGVIVVLDCPGKSTLKTRLENIQETVVFARAKQGSPDYQWLKKLEERVFKHPLW